MGQQHFAVDLCLTMEGTCFLNTQLALLQCMSANQAFGCHRGVVHRCYKAHIHRGKAA